MIKQYLVQLAAKIDGGSVKIPRIDDSKSIAGILNAVYAVAAITAVIIIIIAGIMYSSSSGDPEKIKNAKSTILYAVIGLVVVVLAFAITSFVLGRF